MSFYVSPCGQSYYYDAVATAGSEQGKSFITPVGRRKSQPEHLVASADALLVCVHNTPTLLLYLLLRPHTQSMTENLNAY